MAATRLIALHINKGKTVARCLADRTDYSENEAKTDGGKFISSFGCDPKSCDQEFLLSKKEYLQRTGREQKNDVIAYQIRQSFRPGEITPEEANQVGYELAMRWTKGKHAFIVATHIDRAHIHNHIIYNSTTIDGTRKFRDFHRSGLALQKVSDLICMEHSLSVIEPRKKEERERYLEKSQPKREFFSVKSLEEILRSHKGPGYERWARRFNLKQTAKALCYLQEAGISNFEELEQKTTEACKEYDELAKLHNERETRMKYVLDLRHHIVMYARTHEVYDQYKSSGYSKSFKEAHHYEIETHQAAKRYFKGLGLKKLPKAKDLGAEYQKLREEKSQNYPKLREAKERMQTLLIAKRNIEALLLEERNQQGEKEIEKGKPKHQSR